jgi:prepilin-type N-terminal cleavage/methylation domain-containing protein
MTRRGFSLVELLVTVSMLSVMLVGLVPLTRRIAALSNQSTGRTQRMAALVAEVQQLGVLPFDSLAPGKTCRIAGSSAPYTVCITVTARNDRTLTIQLTVSPWSAAVGPDTVILERSRSQGANPLNLP